MVGQGAVVAMTWTPRREGAVKDGGGEFIKTRVALPDQGKQKEAGGAKARHAINKRSGLCLICQSPAGAREIAVSGGTGLDRSE